ncbi:unnamed protein product [Rodentolepis nana]|uniref:alpha-1,2-Mannosidase n=1 Tax=Rodentolepis nana TaxID=102285 RepID=A0A0R3TYX2_RODNA|nr:unnamed protein product [Rodentolepis nana]
MTKHAWDNYVKYAWGHNELRPKSRTFHDTDILGRVPLGATIVDSIDTLYIMGLEKEYEQASKWIKDNLDFSDAFYLDRAQSVIDNLLPAFDLKSGLPFSLYNLQQKKGRNPHWASNQCYILSEVGTLHMEFQYISELLGQPKYSEIVSSSLPILWVDLSIHVEMSLFF